MNIIYLTSGTFPKGSAYASRTLNIAKALIDSGNKVVVIADYNENVEDAVSGIFDGVEYFLLFKKKISERNNIKNYLSFVSNYVGRHKIDLIICASDYDRFHGIYKISKKQNLPIVLESCEWFGYYNWRFGFLNPKYYMFLWNWCFLYKKVDGVIAISRLLEKHFSKYVKNVIRIPTLLSDSSNSLIKINNLINNNKIKRIIYAGSAGKSKDLLKNIITAVNIVNSEKVFFYFDIYGIDERVVSYQLRNDYKSLCKNNYIRIHGKINQDKVNYEYQCSDLSVLFRPKRRSSNAGFPTKLAESLMAGTPLFCNNTGDISLYISENINGWMVEDLSIKSLVSCLERIKYADFDKMRIEAHNTAMHYFYYQNYVESLNNFVNKVKGGYGFTN